MLVFMGDIMKTCECGRELIEMNLPIENPESEICLYCHFREKSKNVIQMNDRQIYTKV